MLDDPNAVFIDMRNHYESDMVGHFRERTGDRRILRPATKSRGDKGA